MDSKGFSSVPTMFDDEEMQQNFKDNFFRRPIARGRSFHLENFSSLPMIVEIFEAQGWRDFLDISEDIYVGVVPAFYSTLEVVDEDNTSLRSIIQNYELQVLPSDIAEITNTPNDGVICRGGQRWWTELGVSEATVAETLTGNRGMRVHDIQTSSLATPVRAVFSVVQHTVLPRSGNLDVMSEVDQMVVFCLMTKRKINLVRLILDYIAGAVKSERRRHAALPYGMLLTRVFQQAQYPVEGNRREERRPTTTMKTFSALGLKPQDQEDKTGKKKAVQKRKPLPSVQEKEKKKRKKEDEKKPSPPTEKISKRRRLLLEAESSSHSEDEREESDEESQAAEQQQKGSRKEKVPKIPIIRPKTKGIRLQEPAPKKQKVKKYVPGKGKNIQESSSSDSSSHTPTEKSTSTELRQALKLAEKKRHQQDALLRERRSRVPGVGTTKQQRPRDPRRKELDYVVIEEHIPPPQVDKEIRTAMPEVSEGHSVLPQISPMPATQPPPPPEQAHVDKLNIVAGVQTPISAAVPRREEPERSAAATVPIPTPAPTKSPQADPASPAKALLLLTSHPTPAEDAPPINPSPTPTEKLPSEEASTAMPTAAEYQMDRILANQQTIMANQHALERRMDRFEAVMVKILRALEKDKGNR